MKNDLEKDIDCAEVVLAFLRDSINLNVGRAKLGYLFNENMVKESASNPFGLTALDIVLEFANPIINKDNLFEKVDFSFMYALNREFPSVEVSYFNPQEKEGNMTYGSATRFFFYVFEYISKFLVPIFKYAETLSNQIQRMNARVKVAKNEFERNFIERLIKEKKVEFLLYKVSIESEERISSLNKFYTRFFEKLLLDRDNISVPDYYLTDYIEVQAFLANVKKNYYSTSFGMQNFRIYISVLEAFLSENYASANPHVKAKFMDLLFTLNIMEEGRIVTELKGLLQTQEKINQFIRNVLGFYASVEFMTDFQQTGSSKYRYRFFISKFLVKALEQTEYSTALNEAINTKELSNFIGHMVTDLNYFLEEAFEKMAEIKQKEGQTINDDMQNLQIGEESSQMNVEQLRDQVKNYLKFGRSYLRLFDKLSEICPEIFEDPQWSFKVARILNFYAAKMSSKSYKNIKLENVGSLGLKPLEFIRQLISIFVRLSFSNKIKEEIISDERSYDKAILLDIGYTAYKKKLVSEEMIDKFEDLLLELEALKVERDNFKDIIEDAPDEFLCGLTYECMTEPVKLPSSDIIVELSAIKQHLTLNGEYDPFNRQKLTLADLVELPELKKRIEAWVEEKKQMYKAKLKTQQKLKETNAEEYSDHEDHREPEEESIGNFMGNM